MIIAPFTFNETEAEVAWFTAGWDARVLAGTGKHGCPDRNDHPGDYGLQGTQDQRVSWQRGWDAACAACHAVGSSLEIGILYSQDGSRSVIKHDPPANPREDFLDPNGMVKLPEWAVLKLLGTGNKEHENDVEFIVNANHELVIRRK
jgi:hypothetical protein